MKNEEGIFKTAFKLASVRCFERHNASSEDTHATHAAQLQQCCWANFDEWLNSHALLPQPLPFWFIFHSSLMQCPGNSGRYGNVSENATVRRRRTRDEKKLEGTTTAHFIINSGRMRQRRNYEGCDWINSPRGIVCLQTGCASASVSYQRDRQHTLFTLANFYIKLI